MLGSIAPRRCDEPRPSSAPRHGRARCGGSRRPCRPRPPRNGSASGARTASASAVRRPPRSAPPRIDLGQQQHVGARQHFSRSPEQVARARVAVRLEGEHQAPPGSDAPPPASRRFPPDGGRSRPLREGIRRFADADVAVLPEAGRPRESPPARWTPPPAAELGRHADRGERIQHAWRPGRLSEMSRTALCRAR